MTAKTARTTNQNPLPEWLTLRTRVLDTVCGEVGTVSGIGHPYVLNEPPTVVYLRPLGGGLEWQCAIDDVRPCPENAGAAYAEEGGR